MQPAGHTQFYTTLTDATPAFNLVARRLRDKGAARTA